MKKYIILGLLITLFSCTEKKQDTFSFVQLCDTQIGYGGYEHDLMSFNMAVDQINSLKPDFVVICGDLVNHRGDSVYTDFKEIMERFDMPCYPAPGNHDVGQVPTNTDLDYYRETIGEDYYKFQHKSYSFLVTNSQLWKENIENESEKHDKWFKKALRETRETDKAVFVIGHYPLYVISLDEEEGYENLPIAKRRELLKLFEENNVVAYLTGHTHRPIINDYNNIQLVSGEAISSNSDVKYPLGFRTWNVSADSISQQFVLLAPFEQNTKETK